jgi:hypothetical protein
VDVSAVRVPATAIDQPPSSTHDLPGPTFQLLSSDVAYLKLSSVKAADAASYVRSAAGTRGLILDIRNYPSEFMVFSLGQLLVSQPTPFARFTFPDISNPGVFLWRPPIQLIPQEPRYTGKVVILVDETTQSQAEYTTMAFRTAPGAVVIGSTTAGADGDVSNIPLPPAATAPISRASASSTPTGAPPSASASSPTSSSPRPSTASARAATSWSRKPSATS